MNLPYKNSLIYLASPYSSNDKEVVLKRVAEVTEASAILMTNGWFVYAPIVHCHPIAMQHKLPTDWNFWMNMAYKFIDTCGSVVVLQLEGWDKSTGVLEEIKYAKSIGKEVFYIDLDTLRKLTG